MHKYVLRLSLMIAFSSLLLALAWAGLTHAAPDAPAQLPSLVGGFQRHGTSVSGFGVIATNPSLVVGSQTGQNPTPYTALAVRNFGQSFQDIFVRSFNMGTNQWVLRGTGANQGSLNQDRNVIADQPSIDFAGPLASGYATIPWVAWQEQVRTLSNKTNIYASFLTNGQGGERWQVAGDTGGGRGIPSLNLRTTENAENPTLIGGVTTAGAASFLPWVTWEEFSPVARAKQIYVARGEAASGAGIVGGLRWVLVGLLKNVIETSLNVDNSRDARKPDLTFSGQDNTVPWAVWFEEGRGRQARIFAARAIADAGAPGGFRWENVPACTNEQACTLNRVATRDAFDPKIASGSLAGETTGARPWVVHKEYDGRFYQIYVSKFDGTRFVPVGGSLNVNRSSHAYDPDIFFVGNVPHVAWTEDQGGFKLLFVKHLADARPGFERWDLNAQPFRGLNFNVFDPASVPSLHGTKTAPFVAWQEDVRFGNEKTVFEARRVPEGAAWGSNYPPYIRTISGTRDLATSKVLPLASEAAPGQTVDTIGIATITTSCYEVNGWDNLTQVQLKLSDEESTTLLARFDATQNLIFLDGSNNPYGLAPGTAGGVLETQNVRLNVEQTTVTSLGPQSPGLDINWVIEFKRPTQFRNLTQSINLVARRPISPTAQLGVTAGLPLAGGRTELAGDAQPNTTAQVIIETGFFKVGEVNVVREQLILPMLYRSHD